MLSKKFLTLLDALELTLEGIDMGVQTRKITVWLMDGAGRLVTGYSEKSGEVSPIKALERAICSALSSGSPGWHILWVNACKMQRVDPITGEVLELVS